MICIHCQNAAWLKAGSCMLEGSCCLLYPDLGFMGKVCQLNLPNTTHLIRSFLNNVEWLWCGFACVFSLSVHFDIPAKTIVLEISHMFQETSFLYDKHTLPKSHSHNYCLECLNPDLGNNLKRNGPPQNVDVWSSIVSVSVSLVTVRDGGCSVAKHT